MSEEDDLADAGVLYKIEVHGLEPVGQLGPEPWLVDADTAAVLDAIESDGRPARFIGGCVRDAICHKPVFDVDIATPERPERVMELLEQHGIRVVPTGIKHGTVTAVMESRSYEITTLRTDVETDGRHATVAFTDDWIADARRRDFTFNALSATRDGMVYDPFDGMQDLAHGYVKFIGKPSSRIAEDYLRILRFFRFRATHGRPPENPEALMACRMAAEHLKELSTERVRDELLKILAAPNPAEILILMRGENVLQQVLPEAEDPGRLRAVEWLETKATRIDGLEPDRLRRLAATFRADADSELASAIAVRWRLSNHDHNRLADMVGPLGLEPDAPLQFRRKRLYQLGAETFLDRALLTWAAEVAADPRLPSARTRAWIETLELAAGWESPTLPITGSDVMAAGVRHGPAIGKMLSAIEEWWIDGEFRASREDCLAELNDRVAAD